MEIMIKLTSDDDKDLVDKVIAAVTGNKPPGDQFEPQIEATQDLTEAVEVVAEQEAEQQPVGVELDDDGLPWDQRIHASTKAKLKDGKWRKRRNVDESLVKSVEQELRAVMAISAPTQTPEPEPQIEAETVADPLASLAVPPPPADDAVTFSELIKVVSELKSQGKMTDAEFQALYTDAGLPNFAQFNNRPDLIGPAFEKVKSYAEA